jgi:hypothetical protein
MLATSIRHGDLVIDFHADGSVQVVRQSNASGIVLSLSEWQYLCKVMELHEWPMAPPLSTFVEPTK